MLLVIFVSVREWASLSVSAETFLDFGGKRSERFFSGSAREGGCDGREVDDDKAVCQTFW